MARHVIDHPDIFAGDEPRRVLWDDEAGEVSADHSAVPKIRKALRARARRFPARDAWSLGAARPAAEFRVVLGWCGIGIGSTPTRRRRRRVEPAPFTPADIPAGAVA